MKVNYNDDAPTNDASVQKRTAIFQQVISRISAIPGVEVAGISDYLPLDRNRAWGLPLPKGIKPPEKQPDGPLVYVVTPGYVRALGARLKGRDFTWNDGPHSQPVVLIDSGFAHYLAQLANWSEDNVVGQLLDNGTPQGTRIVGIVDNVREESTEAQTGWQIYYPMTQATPTGAEVVVRTQLPPATLAGSVLRTLRDINPNQAAAEFQPLQLLVDHANSPRRFFMLLVAAFASLGLLLASLGIYGVISYTVTRQTQEIGIRMALGATAAIVQRKILGGTVRLALIGVVFGAAASLLTAKLITTLLFATSPWDLPTYLGMGVLLIAVAAVSGYLPARRASRVDPMVALRSN